MMNACGYLVVENILGGCGHSCFKD